MTLRHYLVAAIIALALHGAVALAFLLKPEEKGAVDVGFGGVEIGLGPAGAAPGAAPAPEPEIETVVEPEPPAETPPTPEPPIETAEPVEPVPEPVAAPEPVIVAAQIPTPDLTDIVEIEVAEDAPPEPQPVVEQAPPAPAPPRAKPKRPPRPQVQEARAQPRPEPPRPVAPEPPREASQTPPSLAGQGGRAGTQEAALSAGDGDSAAGGGNPAAEADYFATLNAHLNRHKKYPRRAKSRRQEGVVVLWFMMNQAGDVLEYRIDQSSGHRLLDNAVVDMIEDAMPLPAIPPAVGKNRLELRLPIAFNLI